MVILQITVLDGVPYLWNELGNLDKLSDFAKEPVCIELDLPERDSDNNQLRKQERTAFALGFNDSYDLFLMLQNGIEQGSGIVFSDSLKWYAQMIKLVMSVVARENYLPGIVKDEDGWHARWSVLVDELSQRILDQLIQLMPGVIRCQASDNGTYFSRDHIANVLLNYLLDDYLRNVNEELEPLDYYDSLHDAWLDALDSENSIIKWDQEDDLLDFQKNLHSWRKPLDTQFHSKYKLCFRLTDPEQGEEELWKLEPMLQFKEDSASLIPIFKQENIPGDYIFTALGQAAGICHYVKRCLIDKNNVACMLDVHETISFLKDFAAQLSLSGFALMLPAWWTQSANAGKVSLDINAQSSAMGGSGELNLSALLDYDYTLSIGDTKLSEEELEELTKLKEPVVKVHGQWMMIDQKQIAAALRFIRNKQDNSISAAELLKASLGSQLNVDGLAVRSVQMSGWIKSVFDKLKGNKKFELLSQPDNLKGQLRDYQNYGYSWLSFLRQYSFGACLADDMGLGKTVQALSLILNEYNAGEKRPVLLICPTSVVNNWRREAEKFCPDLPVMIHHGSDRLKKSQFREKANDYALVVSSFGLLQRDVEFIADHNWAGVILDEAQNIKNPRSKQATAARSIKADYRIALTGTPVENHVGDLWALMEFLNPGLLGTQASFKANFYRTIQFQGSEHAVATLKALTSPFILRRMKTDENIIKDLPNKIEVKEYCTLTKEQVALYQSVVNDLQTKVEASGGINRQGMVLSLLMKLKQICNHPSQFLGDNSELDNRSGKLQRLIEMITEIRELDEKVLVFTQFAQMGTLLQEYLQNYFGEEVFFLHGSVPKKKRDIMIDRFQSEDDGPKIFILSLKAGGTGLNLTKANHVIHYDRWWNPAVENQATDRVFRIGQKKNVQVYKFIVSGSLEERIDDMIEKKIGVANMVIDTGEKWLGELSNTELRKLVELSQDVTGD